MLTASIIRPIIVLMMEVVSTSETSVKFYETTRRNNSEENHFHIRLRENQKYYLDEFRALKKKLINTS
jgi:hypothetical protein